MTVGLSAAIRAARPSDRTRLVAKRFHAFLAEKYWRGGLELRSLPKGPRAVALFGIGVICLNLILLVAYLSFRDLSPTSIPYTIGADTYQAPILAFYVSAAIYALGWALLLVGAGFGHPFVFGITALYFLTYFGAFGFSLAATHSPWFAIPAWLVLAGGFVLTGKSHELAHHRKLTAVGLITCFPFAVIVILSAEPIRPLVPPDLRPWIGIVVGLAAAAAILIHPLHLSSRRAFVPVGVVTLGLTALFVLQSLVEAPSTEEALSNALLSFDLVLPFVAIFWFFLGASALTEAVSMMDLTLDSVSILVPRRVLLGIALVLPFAELVVTPKLPIAGDLIAAHGWDLPANVWLTLDLHTPLVALLFLVTLVLAVRRRLTDQLLSAILGLWLLSGLAIYLYYCSFLGFSDVGEEAVLPSTLVMFALGLFSDLYRGGAAFANGNSVRFPRTARLFLYLGALLVVSAISHLELAAQIPSFAQQAALASFDGATYLGIPILMYTLLSRRRSFPRIPRGVLLGLFSGGAMISLIGYLLQNSGVLDWLAPGLVAVLVLAVQEPLKLGALWLVHRGLHRLHQGYADIVACFAIGLGAATMVVHPVAPLPFVPLQWQGASVVVSEFDWPRTLFVYLGHAGAASILGVGAAAAWFTTVDVRKRRWSRWGMLLVAVTFSVLFRWAYSAGFTNWEATLYSTGLVWLYDCLALLLIGPALLWTLAPLLPRISRCRRQIGVLSLALAILLATIALVVWYQDRMVAYPVAREALSIEYPARWQSLSPTGPELLSLQRTFQFGQASVSLISPSIPSGATVEQYVSAIEASMRAQLQKWTAVSRQQLESRSLTLEKRSYQWEDNRSDEMPSRMSGILYYFVLDNRLYTLWAEVTAGYQQETDWDLQRIVRSIRLRGIP